MNLEDEFVFFRKIEQKLEEKGILNNILQRINSYPLNFY